MQSPKQTVDLVVIYVVGVVSEELKEPGQVPLVILLRQVVIFGIFLNKHRGEPRQDLSIKTPRLI